MCAVTPETLPAALGVRGNSGVSRSAALLTVETCLLLPLERFTLVFEVFPILFE